MGENKSLATEGQPSTDGTGTGHNQMDLTRIGDGPDASNSKRYDLGSFLGKYRIIGFLGRGGMGLVYRGFDSLVERDVALKVLPSGLSVGPAARQRFLAEARAVGKLIHPNATALYEVGESDGAYFLAMEFVGGGSIASLLNGQRLPVERATRYLSEVCFGLAAAHEVGLIHRDIKPENLLRTMRDHVKITDFGLAKVLDALSSSSLKLTNPGSMLGTPLYMSPEQFNGSHVDARCDLYAAGATYFHMLTGQAPYSESENLHQLMYAHCQRPVPDVREWDAELPAASAAIIQRAMAKQPDDRYENAEDMAHAAMVLLAELCDSKSDSVTNPVRTHGAAACGSNGSGIHNKPVTIWLLEPSRMQARVLQQQLVELGVANVRTFQTIAETINGLADTVPHGIISAMHLDDGSGDDLAAMLRTHPLGSTIPCFLVSSSSTETGPGLSYPGRPLVLPKPVTKEMMMEVLKRITGSRKQ